MKLRVERDVLADSVAWAARTLPSAVTLVVRRHGQNMTEGRDLVELHVVRAVKKALDRKRDREHTP